MKAGRSCRWRMTSLHRRAAASYMFRGRKWREPCTAMADRCLRPFDMS
ncbi:hypothetical protein IEO21_07828 [Rhodonia placenta]|uniref:Uncharacterized protein n=1 Tax=Rhodonia placenta TaxID=104341 RepID=A0A8H7NXF3_9APHY|nr:hypothetical protein IEO21_07828 [Postia placenta]